MLIKWGSVGLCLREYVVSRAYKPLVVPTKCWLAVLLNIAWSMRPSLVVSLDTNNGKVAAVQQPY